MVSVCFLVVAKIVCSRLKPLIVIQKKGLKKKKKRLDIKKKTDFTHRSVCLCMATTYKKKNPKLVHPADCL